MGDGRYYSVVQFINIVILTFTLIYVVAGGSYFYIKSRKGIPKKQALYFSLLEYSFLILIFLDEITNSLNTSMLFKTSTISLVFVAIYSIIGILCSKYCDRILISFIGIIGGCITIMSVLNPVHGMFFNVYDFNIVEYSVYLKICMGVSLWVLIIVCFFDIYNYRGDKYDFKRSLVLNGCILVQIGAFYAYISGVFFWNLRIYIYVMPFAVVGIGIAALKYMPKFYLPNSYRDAVEDLNELILICNEKGKVMYSNKNFFLSRLDLTKTITPESFYCVFEGLTGVLIEEREEEYEYKLYSNENEYIINTQVERIIYGKKFEGYIYRILDRTVLYEDLKELNHKNNYLKSLYDELLDYSKIVERLNSEKERSKLLFDVQNILGHRIAELIKMLESIENIEIDTPYYLDTVDKAIRNARESLAKIRETVNKFKESYEVN